MPLPSDTSRDFVGKELNIKADEQTRKVIGNAQMFSAEKNWMLRQADFPEIDKETIPVIIRGR